MIDRMDFPLVIREKSMAGSDAREDALSVVMGEDEFRAFYERTARPLWSYLSRITGDRQQADDLLQEAYYRFYRGNRHYENETHRRNSLFQIATNLVRDAHRRAKHRDEVQLSDENPVTASLPSAAPVPERQAAIRTDLERGIRQLEPLQRELLWLAYAQGASHEEIAEILGLRAISIRTLLLRARRKLAAILTGSTIQESER